MSIKLRRLIVAGKDAASFLQGQTTADIHQLTFIDQDSEHAFGLCAICNRQGRVISLFWALQIDAETFHLLLPDSLADKVQKHLTIFIFRSKVTITQDNPAAKELATLPQTLMIPWIIDKNSEEYVPQMLSLDLLKAINFKKGCYTGQEIVARMQYLGKHKRRLALITTEHSADFTVNAKILDSNSKEAGTVVYSEGNKALAVIRLAFQAQALKIQHPIKISHIWHDNESDN